LAPRENLEQTTGGGELLTNTHSAAGPALGYQYQADYCLYLLVKDGGPGRAISLEMHDDVAWDDSGSPVEQLQVKHSVNSAGGLGDSSDRIWRTLKAWIDAGNPGDLDGPTLCLVTTSTAAAGSAAYLLRPASRDAPAAATALRKVAEESTAKETATARAAFSKLAVSTQNALVSRIRVMDESPNVLSIDAALREELWKQLPAAAHQQDDYLALLWGWWRGRAVEMLSRPYFPDRDLSAVVTAAELTSQLTRLTVAFSEHGLPEFDDLDVEDEHESLQGLEHEIFVQQLGFLNYGINTRTVRNAIVDYYRAVSSEVRWLERDFLHSDDVRKYERRLCEAWDIAFGLMVDNLGEAATSAQRVEAGRNLLAQILTKVPLRIRTHVDQDFYYRGKHHMLAQQTSVGWHPEFRDRLDTLLLAKETTA
jgi:hypothetical protein